MEYFHNKDADIIRFYESKNEIYRNPLSDLVIAQPSYGILPTIPIIGSVGMSAGWKVKTN